MRHVLGLVAVLSLLTLPAWAAEVLLKDGGVLTGEVQGMDATHVLFKDDRGIEMRIPREQVEQLRLRERTPEPHHAGSEATAGGGRKEGFLSDLFGDATPPPPPAKAQEISLSEALRMEPGGFVTIRAFYGRVRESAAQSRPGSIYITDKRRELRVAGRIEGLSTYSTDHWGSRVEVSGWLKGPAGGGRWLQMQSARIIQRNTSSVPVHN